MEGGAEPRSQTCTTGGSLASYSNRWQRHNSAPRHTWSWLCSCQSLTSSLSIHPLHSPDPRSPSYKKKGSCCNLCTQRGSPSSLHTQKCCLPLPTPLVPKQGQCQPVPACGVLCWTLQVFILPVSSPSLPLCRAPHSQPVFFLPMSILFLC